ncbi:MAG: acyl-CoA thioesterase [Chloroflexi bacterium]|nr:acyl-CoA thioesterase [Chloroflexota bacterium]
MPYITEIEMPVRYVDQDPQGWVTNTAYMVYFQEVCLAHLRYLTQEAMKKGTTSTKDNWVVAEATIKYRAPLRYPNVVVVRAQTGEIREKGFSLQCTAHVKGTDQLIAEGSFVRVWLGPDSRSAPIPDSFRQAFEESKI